VFFLRFPALKTSVDTPKLVILTGSLFSNWYILTRASSIHSSTLLPHSGSSDSMGKHEILSKSPQVSESRVFSLHRHSTSIILGSPAEIWTTPTRSCSFSSPLGMESRHVYFAQNLWTQIEGPDLVCPRSSGRAVERRDLSLVFIGEENPQAQAHVSPIPARG
jgi:hypothetical protein